MIYGIGKFVFADGETFVIAQEKTLKIDTFVEYAKNKYHFKNEDTSFITNEYGQLTNSNGEIYPGLLEHIKYDGFGIHISPKRGKYRGNYMNGKAHGQGTFTWNDGKKYVGQFYNNTLKGIGTLTFEDGQVINGQFENDNPNGICVCTWKNCQTYVGQFVNGVREGYGTYTWPDGTSFKGQYHKGEKNGEGTLIYPDGRKYVGNFTNSLKNGYGEFYWPTPDKKVYRGQWRNDVQVEIF